MADYIYTMEIRLTPDQQKGATLVQEVARNAGMNLYLTGGAVRDIISGFPIRDLDFTVQGNPLKLQKELEKAGAVIASADEETKTLYLQLPGNVRAEISMARTERYEKVGKPPIIAPATIIEDLRRRDFTINAMALSLNAGSRGLLMDPFNGAADIEAKVIRVLHNYAFVEEPSRLIRATRFAARFHWPLEERTQVRYESAKENNYIEHITDTAIGHEIEHLAYEEDPLHIVRVLEKEGWLKVLSTHWTTAKVDTNGLSQLMKTDERAGLPAGPGARRDVFSDRALEREGNRRHAQADSAQDAGRSLEGSGRQRQGPGKKAHRKRIGNARANLAGPFERTPGDDALPGRNRQTTGRCAEDQEFLH
jgi:tRNA nucleotidyltransferase/poly(A) polymerase